MDMGLGGSVAELLTRVTVVSSSFPGPAMYFHCLHSPSSFPSTVSAVANIDDCDGLRLMCIARKVTPT